MPEALATEKDILRVLEATNKQKSNNEEVTLLRTEQECLIGKLRTVLPIINDDINITKKGLLIQLWMPVSTPDGSIVLESKQRPYLITGVVDLLALYRFECCQQSFSTDCNEPNQKNINSNSSSSSSSIDQVFTSCQPEFFEDFNKYTNYIYLRLNDASNCNVLAVLILPIFNHSESRTDPIAVLELVYGGESLDLNLIYNTVNRALNNVELFTSELNVDKLIRSNKLQFKESDTDTLPNELSEKFELNENSQVISSQMEMKELDTESSQSIKENNNNGDDVQIMQSPGNSSERVLRIGEEGGEKENQENSSNGSLSNDISITSQNVTTSKKTKKINANRLNGGAGKRLNYRDLEKHFSSDLKTAATKLGVCPTTLKRACRRNGISRWPSRQITKLMKTWKQLGYSGSPPKWLLQNAIAGNLRADYLSIALNTDIGVFFGMQQQGNEYLPQNYTATVPESNQGNYNRVPVFIPVQSNNEYISQPYFRNATHHGFMTLDTNNETMALVDQVDDLILDDNHGETWHAGNNFTGMQSNASIFENRANDPLSFFENHDQNQQPLTLINNNNNNNNFIHDFRNQLEETQRGQNFFPMLSCSYDRMNTLENLQTMNVHMDYETQN